MRSSLLLIPLALGAVLCGGARGPGPSAEDVGPGGAARSTAVVVAPAEKPAPFTPRTPSALGLGLSTLAMFGYANWRRRRFLAEHAAL